MAPKIPTMRAPQAPAAAGPKAPAPKGPAVPKARLSPLPSFLPARDPIDESKYPGNCQGDAEIELNQVQAGFRDRMKAEADRFKNATDARYYFVVAMESGDQVDALLRGLGLSARDGGDLLIDGRILAEKMGIALPPADVRYNTSAKVDSRLASLVRKPGAPD